MSENQKLWKPWPIALGKFQAYLGICSNQYFAAKEMQRVK